MDVATELCFALLSVPVSRLISRSGVGCWAGKVRDGVAGGPLGR